jgi:hypothetical protein
MLADDLLSPEFIQLLIASPMVKISGIIANSSGRAGRQTSPAISA